MNAIPFGVYGGQAMLYPRFDAKYAILDIQGCVLFYGSTRECKDNTFSFAVQRYNKKRTLL